jgi:anti-sigma B factor antagonist
VTAGDFWLEAQPAGREDVTLLVATGDVDMTASREFGRRLEAAIGSSPGDIVLDILGIVYLDSTALRALLGARKMAEERASRLVLVCARRPVLHVLEVTGLTRLFEIHPDRDAAIEAIGRANQPKR